MNRTEMVEARKGQLSRMSDRELLQTASAYFVRNWTMPGESEFKNSILDSLDRFERDRDAVLPAKWRAEIIDTFAEISIKELKLKNIRMSREALSELPMALSGTEQSKCGMRDTYAIPATLSTRDRLVYVKNRSGFTQAVTDVPKCLAHRKTNGLTGTMLVTDYSNGNFASLGYTLLIDLAQGLVA